jgi:hypothetical protein
MSRAIWEVQFRLCFKGSHKIKSLFIGIKRRKKTLLQVEYSNLHVEAICEVSYKRRTKVQIFCDLMWSYDKNLILRKRYIFNSKYHHRTCIIISFVGKYTYINRMLFVQKKYKLNAFFIKNKLNAFLIFILDIKDKRLFTKDYYKYIIFFSIFFRRWNISIFFTFTTNLISFDSQF